MTFLGLEKPVGYEVQLIFDPTMAKMVLDALDLYIAAARGEYERGLLDIKDFTNTYGDFMSPFAKDMARYNDMINGVRSIIDDAYAHGIDLTKSPQGRAIIQRAINSVNPAEYNAMRANAKVGYSYLDAALKLRSQGKYSEALELFDILLSGGLGMDSKGNKILNFADFSTAGNGDGWNMFSRTSPIEATSLLDLTFDSYKGRTPRDLTADDLRAAGITPDPRYQYTGYLDSDLMKVAPGAAMAIAADPRAAYFRNLAELKVAARDGSYTLADVDAQFYRDIADANKWALVDPTKKADEFALDRARTENDNWLDQQKLAREHYYQTLEHPDDGGSGEKDKKAGWNVAEDVYVTSLAKGAGVEHLPQEGVSPEEQTKMLKDAEKRQYDAIKRTGDVLYATGSFIAPEKIGGLIQSDGKNGNGYFLNRGYIKNLHTLDDLRTSCRGALSVGINIENPFTNTPERAASIRKQNKQRSKDVVSGIRNDIKVNRDDGYRLKVVPVTDGNNNNTYSFVGDDNRWHTYALVRVYMSDGKTKTRPAGNSRTEDSKKVYDIPKDGVLMGLEVGLHSNEDSGTPDLSVTAREELGFYGYNATTNKVGRLLNTGFPYATNTTEH